MHNTTFQVVPLISTFFHETNCTENIQLNFRSRLLQKGSEALKDLLKATLRIEVNFRYFSIQDTSHGSPE